MGPEQQANFESLIANLPDAVLVLDVQNRVLYANPACERILNVPLGQMLGKTFKADRAVPVRRTDGSVHEVTPEIKQVTWDGSPARAAMIRATAALTPPRGALRQAKAKIKELQQEQLETLKRVEDWAQQFARQQELADQAQQAARNAEERLALLQTQFEQLRASSEEAQTQLASTREGQALEFQSLLEKNQQLNQELENARGQYLELRTQSENLHLQQQTGSQELALLRTQVQELSQQLQGREEQLRQALARGEEAERRAQDSLQIARQAEQVQSAAQELEDALVQNEGLRARIQGMEVIQRDQQQEIESLRSSYGELQDRLEKTVRLNSPPPGDSEQVEKMRSQLERIHAEKQELAIRLQRAESELQKTPSGPGPEVLEQNKALQARIQGLEVILREQHQEIERLKSQPPPAPPQEAPSEEILALRENSRELADRLQRSEASLRQALARAQETEERLNELRSRAQSNVQQEQRVRELEQKLTEAESDLDQWEDWAEKVQADKEATDRNFQEWARQATEKYQDAARRVQELEEELGRMRPSSSEPPNMPPRAPKGRF